MRIVLALVAALCLAAPAGAMGKYPPHSIGDRNPGGAPPVVPEPAAIAVFGVGAAIVGYALYRRRK